ncbi:MAG: hypothetical protein OXG58_05310 [Gemmatimonadetes bacterium]|nr:hypothetical protein [Gemmatimonadota bacterium]
MTERSRQEYYVAQYFRDPDHDPLSFSASVEDATVATAVVEDKNDSITLVIDGVAAGETIVTLTATDPDGGEAEISGRVLVFERELFWRDDFDRATTDWSFNFNSFHSYEEMPGYLSVYNRYSYYLFQGVRNDNDNAAYWMVSMSVAVEEGSTGQLVGIRSQRAFRSPDCGTGILWAMVGEVDLGEVDSAGSNWVIEYRNCDDEGAGSGNSAAVAPIGEFSDLHLGVTFGILELYVGETLLFSQEVEVEEGWPLIHTKTGLVGFGGEEIEQWMYFDWAELWGVPPEEGR